MANDLSTPLKGRKRGRRDPGKPRRHWPVARALGAVVLLLVGGVVARLMLANDPTGGRPVAEVAITSTRNANSVANAAATGPVTLTADPQQYPAGETPPADTAITDANRPDAFGALPDLSEETANGPIPRRSASGETPFAAYRRPVDSATIAGKPSIALIVTGLGINEEGSLEAIDQLPPDVSLGFAPYGKSLPTTVGAARAAGHEVFLELPLEPFDYPQNDPGPQTLLTGDPTRTNLDKLFWLMARFGGYAGVINNMGARFTAAAADFSPVMEELGARGIGYLDDGTSNRSLAPQLAAGNKVPFAKADLAIDTNPAQPAILAALGQLETQALASGKAIGLVSALPISIQTVAAWAQELDAKGIALVPASALMQ